MELTEQQVLAIKRKRGELDLSTRKLANITNVSQWTLRDIFKHGHRNVNNSTYQKLNNWLIDQYTADDNAELAEVVQDNQQTVKG